LPQAPDLRDFFIAQQGARLFCDTSDCRWWLFPVAISLSSNKANFDKRLQDGTQAKKKPAERGLEDYFLGGE
jgi:hypothetical protein